MRLSEFLTQQQAYGHYTFCLPDAEKALGGSLLAVRRALHRAKKRLLIAEPTRGFFTILPPEYRNQGSLPAEHFVPPLMKYLNQPYYIGLLSAAKFYGAAHQQPQIFQVVTDSKRRPINCGSVKIIFIVNKKLSLSPTQQFKTPRGMIAVSTPEVTAMDLVSYPHRCGGLGHVYTVLSELSDSMNVSALLQLLKLTSGETAWIQRLGFLLEKLGHHKLSDVLHTYLQKHSTIRHVLVPKDSQINATYNKKWALIVNAELEADI